LTAIALRLFPPEFSGGDAGSGGEVFPCRLEAHPLRANPNPIPGIKTAYFERIFEAAVARSEGMPQGHRIASPGLQAHLSDINVFTPPL